MNATDESMIGLLADTASGFAGMGFAYTILFVSAVVGFLLTFGIGVVVSARYVRCASPEWTLWPSRGVAAVKQAAGWLLWAYFGMQGHSGFFVDGRRGGEALHAGMLLLSLWLATFAITSLTSSSIRGRSAASIALGWVLWDFALISLPLYFVTQLIRWA